MWQNNLTEGQLGRSDRPISDVLTPVAHYHHGKTTIPLFMSEKTWRILSALTIIGITENKEIKWTEYLRTSTSGWLCFHFMLMSVSHTSTCWNVRPWLAGRKEQVYMGVIGRPWHGGMSSGVWRFLDLSLAHQSVSPDCQASACMKGNERCLAPTCLLSKSIHYVAQHGRVAVMACLSPQQSFITHWPIKL